MENPTLQFQVASELRKKGEYEAAIDIYSELWKTQPNVFDRWSGWGYAYSLLKMNRYEESLLVCRKLYPLYKGFEMLRSVYAANIYYSEFKFNSNPQIHQLKKAANAIAELTPPQSAYSFAPKAIFKLVKSLMAQMEINWTEIEGQLLKLDPEWLDDAAFRYTDAGGKNTERASDLEQWYAATIKAKAGLNKSEELLQLLEEARNKNIKWHYSNNIWFKRKEAFAYMQLGNQEKAEKLLREILLQKKDWFLWFDLSQVVTDENEKFELMCKSALERGKPEMKLKLFESIYQYLKDNNNEKGLTNDHLLLILILRKENDWSINRELLNKLGIETLDSPKILNSEDLLKKLKPFWRENSGLDKILRLEGQISRMLPHGAAGFLKSKEGSFYFILKKGEKGITEGKKVSFEVIDSFDKKKNKPSKMAVNLQLI